LAESEIAEDGIENIENIIPYSNNREHILDELRFLDLLLYSEVKKFRNKTNHDLRGVVITEEEINEITSSSSPLTNIGKGQYHYEVEDGVSSSIGNLRSYIDKRMKSSLENKTFLALPTLSKLFNLTNMEKLVVVLCLAAEFDTKYGRLYAYLQDDMTKKRPTVDLVLRLLSKNSEEKLDLMQIISANSPLMRYNLIQFDDDSNNVNPLLSSRYLKLDERIVAFLLGISFMEPKLGRSLEIIYPEERNDVTIPSELKNYLEMIKSGKIKQTKKIVLNLGGPDEIAKRSFAEAVCKELNVLLLSIDLKDILQKNLPHEWSMRTLCRETLLLPAALYVKGFDITDDEKESNQLLKVLAKSIEEIGWFFFLSGNGKWHPIDNHGNITLISHTVEMPNINSRKEIWQTLSEAYRFDNDVDFETLATKYLFTRYRIERALYHARDLAKKREGEDCKINMKDLYEGCRAQCGQNLASLARKVNPLFTWNDIVLPPNIKDQLKEICYSIKHRRLVYEQWGFEKKLSLGKGLNVLFSGPSGTGKTMAAEIIANDLNLEMYKIDLSMVVSKWIGKTEKNLSGIFNEAREMNAILFFDEADSLFGKRTSIKDSHDRYANMEINFLLQKLEEFDGIVILASNYKENIDNAFSRRMHHAVEFPFPDEESRLTIWENIFPKDAPLENNVDLRYLANKFKISGGNIKNVALCAAFLAAEASSPISMIHVMKALKREYMKMGTIPPDVDLNLM